MKYSKVRKYVNQVIKSYDKCFTEHKDAFNDENIASTRIDKGYHVFYSVPSVNKENNVLESVLSVEIKFFFKGGRYPMDEFDKAMDEVSDIAFNLGEIKTLAAFRSQDDFPIQRFDVVSQVAEQLENNDNLIRINLTLDASIYEALC